MSSTALGLRMGSTASQVRQDLSWFGEFGQQGKGYDVRCLLMELGHVLGMHQNYTAVFTGVGRLAKALVCNFPFEKYGIRVKALYDIDPDLIGMTLYGLPIYHVDQLREDLAREPVDIGILTASPKAAAELAETFAEGGVTGIWNFTNVELHPQKPVRVVENVDLFDSLFKLCCQVNLA